MMAASPTEDERRRALAGLRRKAGLSQEDLAEALGASRSSIQRWESGTALPHPRLLVKWADELGISVDELDELLWSGGEIVRSVSGTDKATPPAARTAARAEPSPDDVPADLVSQNSLTDVLDTGVEEAIASLLGLGELLSSDEELPPVALAMSSFQGVQSVGGAVPVDDGEPVPASFVQGDDDISGDVFFGKRDVLLANQVSAGLVRLGFRQPLYVEDRSVWRALGVLGEQGGGPLTIQQYGQDHPIGVLVVVGLWSNLLATALADWEEFPQFQMSGDPANHSTRTIRMCSPEGLRIIDLNASPETDELGGNPAVIVARKIGGLHVITVGGATSLSTLRLAELLVNEDVWRQLASHTHDLTPEAPDSGGAWIAIECPNATRWKDRCRVVGSNRIGEPINKSLGGIRRSAL